MTVFLLANGCFQGNRLLGNLQNFPYPLFRHIHLFRNFFRCRFSPQFLQELSAHTDQFVDRFYHMHGNPNGSCLICNSPGNGLADPPGSIGGKFISLTVIKFFHRLNQAHIPFLNQIQKQHPPTHIPFCNAHHKTQIGFRKTLFRFRIAQFHTLCQVNLLFCIQQRHLADFLEIHSDRVFNADTVRHGQINVFHIDLILFRQNNLLFVHIIVFGNAQYIHMVLFQHFYNLVKLFLFQRQIRKEVVDFLIFQNILFLFGNVQEFFHLLVKLCPCVFVHSVVHPSITCYLFLP